MSVLVAGAFVAGWFLGGSVGDTAEERVSPDVTTAPSPEVDIDEVVVASDRAVENATDIAATPTTTAVTGDVTQSAVSELSFQFTQADGPPTGLAQVLTEAELAVVGNEVTTDSTDAQLGVYVHSLDLTDDWEVIFDYDVRGATVPNSGYLTIKLLNDSDFSGWGMFLGDSRTTPEVVSTGHIQRVDSPGTSHFNVTNSAPFDPIGRVRLRSVGSDNFYADRWDHGSSSWVQVQSSNQTGALQTAGTSGVMLISLQTDDNATNPIQMDNLVVRACITGVGVGTPWAMQVDGERAPNPPDTGSITATNEVSEGDTC